MRLWGGVRSMGLAMSAVLVLGTVSGAASWAEPMVIPRPKTFATLELHPQSLTQASPQVDLSMARTAPQPRSESLDFPQYGCTFSPQCHAPVCAMLVLAPPDPASHLLKGVAGQDAGEWGGTVELDDMVRRVQGRLHAVLAGEPLPHNLAEPSSSRFPKLDPSIRTKCREAISGGQLFHQRGSISWRMTPHTNSHATP